MQIVLGIIGVVLLVFMIWCLTRDGKLAGFYKEIGVGGRWYGFFTGYALLMGVACTVALPVLIVLTLLGTLDGMAADGTSPWMLVLVVFLADVIVLPIALLLYRRAWKKCPENLKKRLPWDMFVIFMGAMLRVSLFFLAFYFHAWFGLPEPEHYVTEDGRKLYAYPGRAALYNEFGVCVGQLTEDGKAILD